MNRVRAFQFSVLSLLLFATSSFATTYTYTPNPADLYDLDHYKAYSWKIDLQLKQGEVIESACIFFDNIKNFDNNSNILYVTLLNNLSNDGVTTYSDNVPGFDNFFKKYPTAIEISSYKYASSLFPATEDYKMVFSNNALAALRDYATDGIIGLGFDPDCHFYNDGIKLIIKTSPVPEPASMFLFGAGLMGLAGVSRMRKK